MQEINNYKATNYKVVVGGIEINGYSTESEIPSNIIEIDNKKEVIKAFKEMVNGKAVWRSNMKINIKNNNEEIINSFLVKLEKQFILLKNLCFTQVSFQILSETKNIDKFNEKLEEFKNNIGDDILEISKTTHNIYNDEFRTQIQILNITICRTKKVLKDKLNELNNLLVKSHAKLMSTEFYKINQNINFQPFSFCLEAFDDYPSTKEDLKIYSECYKFFGYILFDIQFSIELIITTKKFIQLDIKKRFSTNYIFKINSLEYFIMFIVSEMIHQLINELSEVKYPVNSIKIETILDADVDG